MADRYRRMRKIQSLDPATDHREIVELFYTDFQTIMALQLVTGNLFTFAAPRISSILEQSGQFQRHTEKRVVDTALFAQAILKHGFGPGQGRDAARRVNAMHRHYDIHQDDFLAVGCDAPVMSVRIAERFGWRPVTDHERQAMATFYDREARLFGSHRSLPDTLEKMAEHWDDYVEEQVRYEPQNERLARAFLDYLPRLFPRGIGRPLVSLLVAQVDPRILRACGLPAPSALRKRISSAALRGLGATGPGPDLPPGKRNPIEKIADRIYPRGWDVHSLGTHLPE